MPIMLGPAASSPGSASIHDLPYLVLQRIFLILACEIGIEGQLALHNCCLVSRSFYRVACPCLYIYVRPSEKTRGYVVNRLVLVLHDMLRLGLGLRGLDLGKQDSCPAGLGMVLKAAAGRLREFSCPRKGFRLVAVDLDVLCIHP